MSAPTRLRQVTCFILGTRISIGKLRNFVKIDSKFTEDLWHATEDRLHDALEAVRTKRLFEFPELVSAIKDAIALHYSRSLEILEVHKLMWEAALEHEVKNHQANPAMSQLFVQKYGIVPPSLSTAQQIMAEVLVADTRTQYESGALFRLRVVDLFEETRGLVEGSGLQIAIPESGGVCNR